MNIDPKFKCQDSKLNFFLKASSVPKSHTSISVLQCSTLFVWCANLNLASVVPNRALLFFFFFLRYIVNGQ